MLRKKHIVILILTCIIVVASCFLLFSKQAGVFVFNKVPLIESYIPSEKNPEVNEGDSITLSISASDPDGDLLIFTWLLSDHVIFEEGTGMSSSNSSWVYTPEYGDRGQHTVECKVSDGKGGYNAMSWGITVCYIELHVALDEWSMYGGEWVRNEQTDLPMYQDFLFYTITNHGTGVASNLNYAIYIDDSTYYQNVIPALSSHESYSNQLLVQLDYDTNKKISISASTKYSSDSNDFSFEATLPRHWSWMPKQVTKLYITPNDSVVKDLVKEIQRTKFPLIPDWIAIRDWVGNNINYRYDTVAHDSSDFWQLPRETLSSRTGDCEDFAILLCTLYRAVGFKTNEVYVVIGEKGESCHGWVKVYIEIIAWQNIEPQLNGWGTFIGDFLTLSGYTAKYNFNDVYSR